MNTYWCGQIAYPITTYAGGKYVGHSELCVFTGIAVRMTAMRRARA